MFPQQHQQCVKCSFAQPRCRKYTVTLWLRKFCSIKASSNSFSVTGCRLQSMTTYRLCSVRKNPQWHFFFSAASHLNEAESRVGVICFLFEHLNWFLINRQTKRHENIFGCEYKGRVFCPLPLSEGFRLEFIISRCVLKPFLMNLDLICYTWKVVCRKTN